MSKYKITSAYRQIDSQVAGVYVIRALCYHNEWKILPWYIGSGKSIRGRIINHFLQLRNNKHCNKIFQNFYNKYGEQNFEIDILEICSTDKTITREQFYLDTFKTFADIKAGFNIARIAESSQRGKKWSNERKEQTAKIHNSAIYKKKKDKAYEHVRKKFCLFSPLGARIEAIGLIKFCKQNNLRVDGISRLLQGEIPSVKGWRLTLESKIHKRSKTFKIISPFGNLIEATNITKFAQQHGINVTSLRHVIHGKRKEFCGWKNGSLATL